MSWSILESETRVYRKHRRGSETEWHFDPHCLDWPEVDYIERAAPPIYGALMGSSSATCLCVACALLLSSDSSH